VENTLCPGTQQTTVSVRQKPKLLIIIIYNHNHVAIKELGHFLTCSGLTRPGVSSMVFLGSFCLLGCSFLSVCVICYVAFDLHVVSNFSCSPVFCLKQGLCLSPLQSRYLINVLSKCILLFFSYISSLLLSFFLHLLL
jgi:hypothetical protein